MQEITPAVSPQIYKGYLAPDLVINMQGTNKTTTLPIQTPTLISSTPPFALGTYSVNYRNEPPLRIMDPATGKQSTAPEAGDLAHVFRSIPRRIRVARVPPCETLTSGCTRTIYL